MRTDRGEGIQEYWSGHGEACPLLVMYCNDMDSLYRRRMAFRYSIFMLVVWYACVSASERARVCVGERVRNYM